MSPAVRTTGSCGGGDGLGDGTGLGEGLGDTAGDGLGDGTGLGEGLGDAAGDGLGDDEGVGDGEGVGEVVMTSCGGLVDSLLANASAVWLLVVRTKSTLALLGIEARGRVMLSTKPAVAGPEEASTTGSHEGWLFHVSAFSTHVSSDNE
jgi:hypothetical protein